MEEEEIEKAKQKQKAKEQEMGELEDEQVEEQDKEKEEAEEEQVEEQVEGGGRGGIMQTGKGQQATTKEDVMVCRTDQTIEGMREIQSYILHYFLHTTVSQRKQIIIQQDKTITTNFVNTSVQNHCSKIM